MATKRLRTGVKVNVTAEATSEWEDRLSAHLKSESGRLAYNTARKVAAGARQRVPQPPGKAWWYLKPPNPKTGKTVPAHEQYIRTGELRKSIERIKVKPGEHHVVVGHPAGRYVEYGTRMMPAQPFMAPAIRSARTELRKTKKGLLTFRRKRIGKTGP